MRETIVDRAYAKTLLPPRKEDGHKGDFGKLLVLGGSVGYTGAPYLAASAAVHSGCGLVYLGVPESIWAVEAQKCVSAMPFPLPETDGRLCLAALDKMPVHAVPGHVQHAVGEPADAEILPGEGHVLDDGWCLDPVETRRLFGPEGIRRLARGQARGLVPGLVHMGLGGPLGGDGIQFRIGHGIP